ncbi:MAG: hypothetical protein ACLUAO_00660 [Streptococcus sp.]
MTGTGKVAEKEFLDTYGMKVIQIPTNRKDNVSTTQIRFMHDPTRRSLLL